MRYIIPILILAFALPAMAEEGTNPNVIRVIQDDGSVVEVDISAPTQPAPQSAPPARPAPPPEPPPPQYPAEPEWELQPEPNAAQPKSARPARSSAPAKPATPTPRQKPDLPRAVEIQKELENVPENAIPEDAILVSEDDAITIALDHAPPSRGFHVERSTYKGKNVYAVIFKVENGTNDVLVDMRTGEVYGVFARDGNQTRKPGVIPLDALPPPRQKAGQ